MSSLSQELASTSVQGPTAVTIGVFDGVHRGHQHLIGRLRQVAERDGATPVVVTFRNHPLTVLRPDVPLALLTTLDERVRIDLDTPEDARRLLASDVPSRTRDVLKKVCA